MERMAKGTRRSRRHRGQAHRPRRGPAEPRPTSTAPPAPSAGSAGPAGSSRASAGAAGGVKPLPRWWEAWPGRLEAELEALREAGLDLRRDEEEWRAERLVLCGKAPLDRGETTRVLIAYPDTYPHTRCEIYAPDLDLERHQHPFGRNICLLPRGGRHWRPAMMAADLVAERRESAREEPRLALPEVVKLVREGGAALVEAEDPQGEPFSDYYAYWRAGAVVVTASALSLPHDVKRGDLTLRMGVDSAWLEALLDERPPSPPPLGRALLQEVRDPAGRSLATAEGPLVGAFAGRDWKGPWLRLERPAKAPGGPAFLSALLSEHGLAAVPPLSNSGERRGRFAVIGVVFPEEVRQGEYEDAWAFLVLAAPAARRPPRVQLLRGMRFSPEDLAARIPELRPLPDKEVAIVGLGTLGAPIAQELARGLIGGLRLLDHDVMEAATAVRWPLGLSAAGAPKPHALAEWIRANHPYTDVAPYEHFIGIALPTADPGRSELEVLGCWAGGADLLVDATGEENVSRVVSWVGSQMGIPQLYVWSVEGYGGVIACLRPGETGCHHCLELAISPEGGHLRAPRGPADAGQVRVQPRGCADPTFAAPAIDLVPLATEAARLAVGLLCGGAENGYPRTAADVLLLQLREPDGSLIVPARWSAHALPPDRRCPSCSGDD